MEERVFSHQAVREILKGFVCVRLDGRGSAENRALKHKYGPVVLGNVQNRIVSPSGENLSNLPTHFDTPELVSYLKRWLAVYPGEEEPPPETRPLPYFTSLHQALNVAACDARVLVVVLSAEARPAIEKALRPLAWSPEFAGRLHFVRARLDDNALDRIRGIATAAEVALLVIPHEFGMTGEASAHIASDTSPEGVLEAARAALRAHDARFTPRTVVEKFQLHTKLDAPDWHYARDTGR